MKLLSVIAIYFFFCPVADCQEVDLNLSIRIKTMAYGDSIRVLWMPGSEEVWTDGINNGYNLTRKTVKSNNKFLNFEEQEQSKVSLGKFKCIPFETWMSSLDTTDQWEVLAAGMVHGTLEEVVPDGPFDLSSFVDNESSMANRYTFNLLAISHSFKAAVKMGLAFTDQDVIPGNTYLYEVFLSGQENSDEIIILNERSALERLRVIDVMATDEGLAIIWPVKYLEDTYVSYEVERTAEQDTLFEKLNASPVIQARGQSIMHYLDNTAEASLKYRYRIRGYTAFGQYGDYVKSGEITYTKPTTPKAPILNEVIAKGDTIWCKWRYEGEITPGLKSNVYFSEQYDGPFTMVNEQVISTGDNELVITEKLPSGYFYIEVSDKDGKSMTSIKRMYNPEDVLPPEVPELISCDMDTINNKIVVEWEENNEPDLMGYRLFMANQDDGHYVEVSPGVIVENAYALPVTSQGNGEKMWFKVSAVDRRFNNSGMSGSCMISLPDRTPPAPPLIRKVINGDSSVVLEWAISPAYDVVAHRIERKSEKERAWMGLKEFNSLKDIQLYEDFGVKPGIKYFYRIMAIDAGGNEAPSVIRIGRLDDKKWKADIEEWTVEVKNRDAVLSWSYVSPALLDRVVIYRRTGDGDFITYKTMKVDDLTMKTNNLREYTYQWIDKGLNKDRFIYTIRAVWADGGTSRRASEKPVEIK